MKILKVIIGIVVVLITFQGVRYLDLLVSEKYETQLEGLTEVTEGVQNQIDEKNLEIEKSKDSIQLSLLILIIVAVLVLVMFLSRRGVAK